MIESRMSGPEKHWTEERLIAQLYGVETGDDHLLACAKCQARLSNMVTRREQLVAGADGVSPEYLMAQRRRIYAALSRNDHWWLRMRFRRWVPAGAATLALAASLLYYGTEQRAHQQQNSISDAQLAQDVSQLAQGGEAPQTAPLQGLFVE